ncbi:MAG: hypothetical protein ACR2K2_12600 [Mycobacteriales bacterium]
MQDDFDVIIDSLGNMTLSWVPQAESVCNAEQGTATVEICLRTDDWQVCEAAADKMVELRGMFIDDLSMDYRFTHGVADCRTSEYPGARQYA